MSKPDESISFLKSVNEIYGGNSYLEKNGMSILVAGFIITIVFSIIHNRTARPTMTNPHHGSDGADAFSAPPQHDYNGAKK